MAQSLDLESLFRRLEHGPPTPRAELLRQLDLVSRARELAEWCYEIDPDSFYELTLPVVMQLCHLLGCSTHIYRCPGNDKRATPEKYAAMLEYDGKTYDMTGVPCSKWEICLWALSTFIKALTTKEQAMSQREENDNEDPPGPGGISDTDQEG